MVDTILVSKKVIWKILGKKGIRLFLVKKGKY